MSSSPSLQKPAKTGKKDAIAMLVEDHKRVKELFQEFRRFECSRFSEHEEHKQELMDAVCSELKVHTRLEEEIFYPAVRAALATPQGEELADEAEVEHATAKALIEQIEKATQPIPGTAHASRCWANTSLITCMRKKR